jgi:hypothetical protein
MNNIISSLRTLILNSPNSPEFPVYNSKYIPSRAELLDTETLNTLIKTGRTNVQEGGKNIIQIKGLRYENNLSDVNSSSTNVSEMYGGKKNKPSVSDTLHQEAVDYLKDDLKLLLIY